MQSTATQAQPESDFRKEFGLSIGQTLGYSFADSGLGTAAFRRRLAHAILLRDYAFAYVVRAEGVFADLESG